MPFFLSLFLSLTTLAAEPDNFSARRDAKAIVANVEINRTINAVLDLNLSEFSARNGCDRKKFMDFINDDLDRNFPKIYKAVYLNAPIAGPISSQQVPYRKGRPYTDLYFAQSYKVQSEGQTYFVGLDKIDHFFSHGATYWDIVGQDPKLPKEKVKQALEFGIQQEHGSWGLQKPGVKSYGDLVANYKGLYFWRDLFDGKPAIIACKNGRFVKNREFKLEDYFSPGMDESLNCNSYADKELLSAIKTVTDKWGQKCPADSKACDGLKKDFADLSPLLLHPLCQGTGTSQIEAASTMSTRDILDTVEGAAGGGPDYLLFKLFTEKKKQGTR